MNYSTPRTEIVAHRGASNVAPENTLAAINKAVEAHADRIEIDVRISEDRKVVLLHDLFLKRTTNLRGRVFKVQSEKLLNCDAGSWFHPKFSEEHVPSLDEVFQAAPSAKWLIEIKGSFSHFKQFRFAEELIEVIIHHKVSNRCIIQSFDFQILEFLHQTNPDIELHQLIVYRHPSWPFYFDKRPRRGSLLDYPFLSAINPDHRFLSASTVETIHKYGKKVFCWTVNDIKRAQHLIELGVDGIITNEPELFVKGLNR